ncbi:TPA: 30S ribosomal protein S17 [bacterium]|nr:MAG: 30S ribosomal protein S17 [Candidatus Hydrogenedentes bacterium CG1_02_42_14]PIU47984.1 MAG: 30S ribosomal protein S17 [Candidatus Hydrogenedentes bacterium CG07_land_8_20_14_0_80_42_17]HBW47620.1 30S ribosomal protein S17 [bacterium]
MNKEVGQRKELIGTVRSNAMEKTIVVDITRTRLDKLYKKQLKVTKKIMAHDEKNSAKVGDKVRVVECRPLSKSKRWRLVEVIERAKLLDSGVEVQQ